MEIIHLTQISGNFGNRVKFEINAVLIHETCASLSLDNTWQHVENLVKLCIKIEWNEEENPSSSSAQTRCDLVGHLKKNCHIFHQFRSFSLRRVWPFGSPLVIRKVPKYSTRLAVRAFPLYSQHSDWLQGDIYSKIWFYSRDFCYLMPTLSSDFQLESRNFSFICELVTLKTKLSRKVFTACRTSAFEQKHTSRDLGISQSSCCPGIASRCCAECTGWRWRWSQTTGSLWRAPEFRLWSRVKHRAAGQKGPVVM